MLSQWPTVDPGVAKTKRTVAKVDARNTVSPTLPHMYSAGFLTACLTACGPGVPRAGGARPVQGCDNRHCQAKPPCCVQLTERCLPRYVTSEESWCLVCALTKYACFLVAHAEISGKPAPHLTSPIPTTNKRIKRAPQAAAAEAEQAKSKSVAPPPAAAANKAGSERAPPQENEVVWV